MTYKPLSVVPFAHPWPEKPLGDIATVVVGGTPSTHVPAYWGGDIPWMASGDVHQKRIKDVEGRITTLGLQSSNATLVEPPSVAVALAGQGKTRGTAAKVLARLCANQSVALIAGKPNELHQDFLFHNLDFRYEELRARSSGGGRGGLSKGILEDTPIPTPDYAEQARIAEVLDTADEAISISEEVIAKLQSVQVATTRQLLEYGMDQDGVARNSSQARNHAGWMVRSMMDLVELPSGQVDPRRDPFSNWVLVAPDHMESGTGRLIEKVTAREQGAISGKYAFLPGDVLYSKIRPYLRKAVLADFQGLCSADVYPLRPQEGVNGRFLLALILGERFSAFAESVSMRSGFPKINREELAEYRVSVPPIDEQNRIADLLLATDERLHSEQVNLAKLKALKSGLTSDLLTGRARVPVGASTC